LTIDNQQQALKTGEKYDIEYRCRYSVLFLNLGASRALQMLASNGIVVGWCEVARWLHSRPHRPTITGLESITWHLPRVSNLHQDWGRSFNLYRHFAL